MLRAIAIGLLASALVAAVAPKEPDVKDRPRRSTDLPRPRDGNIAIQEELDAAWLERTPAAYDRFIARHPDHPLAEIARRERAALAAAPR